MVGRDNILTIPFYTAHIRHEEEDRNWLMYNPEDGVEKRLIKDLLRNYNKFARPRLNRHLPVTVLVDLVIIQFEDVVSSVSSIIENMILQSRRTFFER